MKSDGMANYLSKIFPNLATYTHPLKYVFREKNEWCWGTPQKGFSEIKIRSQQVLASFSPTTEAHVSADATSFELWGILSQSRGRIWKPIVLSLWIFQARLNVIIKNQKADPIFPKLIYQSWGQTGLKEKILLWLESCS